MANQRANLFRHLADDLLAKLPEELLSSPRSELSTSLVRQWMTYDGYATLILGDEQQIFRQLPSDDDHKLRFDVMRIPVKSWWDKLSRMWEFDADRFGDAVQQLNLGQSTQIENRHGELLRLWINPKEQSHGIERLSAPHTESETPKDNNFATVARIQIEALFNRIPPNAKEDLIASIARQWEQQGHASILTPKHNIHLVWNTIDDRSEVGVRYLTTRLPEELMRRGVTKQDIHSILHRLNKGESAEFTDSRNRRCRIDFDSKTSQVHIREVPPSPWVFQATASP